MDRASTAADINRWTYALLVAIFIAVIMVSLMLPYVAADDPIPASLAGTAFILLVFVGPALAFTQSTEFLFDGFRYAIRLGIPTALLYLVVSWLQGSGGQGASIYSSRLLAMLMGAVATVLYVLVLFGVVWAVQFAVSGTRGVRDEFH